MLWISCFMLIDSLWIPFPFYRQRGKQVSHSVCLIRVITFLSDLLCCCIWVLRFYKESWKWPANAAAHQNRRHASILPPVLTGGPASGHKCKQPAAKILKRTGAPQDMLNSISACSGTLLGFSTGKESESGIISRTVSNYMFGKAHLPPVHIPDLDSQTSTKLNGQHISQP